MSKYFPFFRGIRNAQAVRKASQRGAIHLLGLMVILIIGLYFYFFMWPTLRQDLTHRWEVAQLQFHGMVEGMQRKVSDVVGNLMQGRFDGGSDVPINTSTGSIEEFLPGSVSPVALAPARPLLNSEGGSVHPFAYYESFCRPIYNARLVALARRSCPVVNGYDIICIFVPPICTPRA